MTINYQKYLDKWCEKYEVPNIKVTVRDDMGNMHGQFFPSDYYIELKKGASLKILKHEFAHYLFRIKEIGCGLEEAMCELLEETKL